MIVREIKGVIVHTHRIETAWFGFLQEHHRAYRNELEYRTLHGRVGYYDLIELPSGGHIPVPMAIGLIGRENVCRIPIDRKRKRDDDFFKCRQCAEDAHPLLIPYRPDGGSFYRCREHCKDRSEEEYNKAKEDELCLINKAKQYRRLRYIRSVR